MRDSVHSVHKTKFNQMRTPVKNQLYRALSVLTLGAVSCFIMISSCNEPIWCPKVERCDEGIDLHIDNLFGYGGLEDYAGGSSTEFGAAQIPQDLENYPVEESGKVAEALIDIYKRK